MDSQHLFKYDDVNYYPYYNNKNERWHLHPMLEMNRFYSDGITPDRFKLQYELYKGMERYETLSKYEGKSFYIGNICIDATPKEAADKYPIEYINE